MEVTDWVEEQQAIWTGPEDRFRVARARDMGGLDFGIQARSKSRFECDFIIRQLHAKHVRTVLDVVAFTRFHSARLTTENLDVTTLDGSHEALHKKFTAARGRNTFLNGTKSANPKAKRYDAVLCLGNSFTQLFAEADYSKYVAEFHMLLNPNGILVVDQIADSKESCPLRSLMFWAGFKDVQTFGDFQEISKPSPSFYVHMGENSKRGNL